MHFPRLNYKPTVWQIKYMDFHGIDQLKGLSKIVEVNALTLATFTNWATVQVKLCFLSNKTIVWVFDQQYFYCMPTAPMGKPKYVLSDVRSLLQDVNIILKIQRISCIDVTPTIRLLHRNHPFGTKHHRNHKSVT